MALDVDDLTISLAGLAADPFHYPAPELRRAIEVSAHCGCRGVSMWTSHLDELAAAGSTAREVGALCGSLGVPVRMVEAATGWARGHRADIDAEARLILERAAELGAEEVLACSLEEAPLALDAAVDGFGYLCDLAAPHGLRIGLEFLPWTSIADLRTAWSIVAASGRPNGGLVLDTWHWHRQPGGPDATVLGAIPPERFHVLQLNDAAADPEPGLAAESMQRRLLPGDGSIDLDGLLRALEVVGAEPMIAPEVFNDDLRSCGIEEATRRIVAASRRVLARDAGGGWRVRVGEAGEARPEGPGT